MKFFFEFNWKFVSTLVMFYALFVSSNSVRATETYKNLYGKVDYPQSYNMADPQTEKERLRECLANVLLNAEKKENVQEKILLSVVGALSHDNATGNDINLDLLKALKSNIAEGNKLIGKIFAFCNYMNDEIKNLKIPEEEKVKLKIRLEELKGSAENFGLLVRQPTQKETLQHKNCRVLDVSDHLQIVVISAGFLDGVRPGLILYVKQADDAVMKVIAVRPFISAAIVIEGKLGNVSPGMWVRFHKK